MLPLVFVFVCVSCACCCIGTASLPGPLLGSPCCVCSGVFCQFVDVAVSVAVVRSCRLLLVDKMVMVVMCWEIVLGGCLFCLSGPAESASGRMTRSS